MLPFLQPSYDLVNVCVKRTASLNLEDPGHGVPVH